VLYKVPDKLCELAKIFKERGFSLYLVGGAVRDYLLGKQNHDYDFTTDAEPTDIKQIFKRTIDTGIKHGTVTVLYKGGSYEITTFRTEGEYKDKRHPDSVCFVKSLEEDLKRRDFTINALASDLFTGELIDYNNGLSDLSMHIIRAIGNPLDRFREDALRMLRACRFSSKLDFDIEQKTLDAIKQLHENVKAVSAERIKEEFFKLIDGIAPRKGLEAMRTTGLMHDIIPELSKCYGVEQNGFHNEDVYEHQILALERCQEKGYPIEVKVAALLHDIGKPETKKEGKEHFTYYGHDLLSAKLTISILRRLKASNQEIEDISHLIEMHMFSYTSEWSDSAIRRFIKRVGTKYIDRLFMLRDADIYATTGPCPDSSKELLELKKRIKKELEEKNAISLKDLAINGNDLLKLGLKGKDIGATLSKLLDIVIDEPKLNAKEKLLSIANDLSLDPKQ